MEFNRGNGGCAGWESIWLCGGEVERRPARSRRQVRRAKRRCQMPGPQSPSLSRRPSVVPGGLERFADRHDVDLVAVIDGTFRESHVRHDFSGRSDYCW
jgi:hypothetical protein